MAWSSAPGPARRALTAAAALGLAGGLAQVVLLRELLVLAGGNELSLALGLGCWLVWTSVGSLAAGRLLAGGAGPSVAWPLLGVGMGALASLLLARLAPASLGLHLGQVPSLVQALGACLLALAPVGLALGAAFPLVLGSLDPAQPGQARLLARVYGLEALGSTLAGALFGLALAPRLDPLAVLLGGALAAGLVAAWAGAGRARLAAWAWAALLLLALAFSPGLDLALRQRQWTGWHLLDRAETPYAQLVATRRAGQTNFFASGLWLFSHPDLERRERAALLPLLAQPQARNALFLGGAAEGSAGLALERGGLTSVTAVELDPWLVEFAARWTRPAAPPPAGLRLATGDGRAALLAGRGAYDLVVVDLPPPVTVGFNRFYSQEGLAALAGALGPGGVAVITWPGVDEYLGRLQARQLGCLLAAARRHFARVLVMPGPELRLFCTRAPDHIPTQAADWQARLAARGWPQVSAVRPDTLEEGLDPRRRQFLEAMLERAGPAEASTDLRPRALLFDPQLWGAQLGGWSEGALALARLQPAHLAWPLLALAALCGLAGARGGGPAGPARALLGMGVFITGLTSLALSALLLMAFQVLFGAVYVGLALLLGAFMLGLAAAALGLSRGLAGLGNPRAALALVSGCLALACLATLGLIKALHGRVPSAPAWQAALLLAAALDGALTGAYFGLAGRWRLDLEEQRTGGAGSLPALGGGLYGLDLAGGVAGAAWPLVLAPTLGLEPALWLLGLLNLAPLAGLWGLGWRARPRGSKLRCKP